MAINTLNLNDVYKIGTGSHAVICLNGWFGHARHWGDWQNLLNQQDFTWYFPDYRGYGSRQAVQGKYDLAEIAEDIIELISQIPEQKISLLGHSMGGMFMQKVLLMSPRPIHSLVGITPVPATGTPLPPEQKAFFESAGKEPTTRRAIIDITTGNRLSTHWLDMMMQDSVKSATPDAVAGYFYAWADSDIFAQLATRNEPILVIIGEHDVAVTKSVVENSYAKTFSNLQLVTLQECGHYPMNEVPVILATCIERFLLSGTP